ncbi:MAG: T9SS type A sorting domain-containing protein [Bacteroidota bacterium]
MKKANLFFLSFSLLLTVTIFAQNLQPSTTATVLEHLAEVNQQWTIQDIGVDFLDREITFRKDEERIQLHLQLVEKTLRKRNVTKLTATQKANRIHYLDVLKTYWQRGLFPKNSYHPHRQPYFVDEVGTACAVGHLVKASGATDLVEKIRQENNYGYISELQIIYPELKNWAVENGFTLAELAWIQPGYPPLPQAYYEVGNGGGVDGKINVMKTSKDGSVLYMAGDFSEIDGVAANSIVSWDGENWSTLGEGVTGEIFTITTDNLGGIYVGGNFILNDNPQYSNIAYWDGIAWTGIQAGEMGGTVFTLSYGGGGLFAGGDFDTIDGQPIKYLARYQHAVWTNHTRIFNTNPIGYDTIQNSLAVDGPVYTLHHIDNAPILVGGDFTMTAPEVLDTVINQFFTNLAYWKYWGNTNWEIGLYSELENISCTFRASDGNLYVGGNYDGGIGLGILNAGFWEYPTLYELTPDLTNHQSRIHGFLEHNQVIYAFGNIQYVPIIGTYATGLVQIGGINFSSFNAPGGAFDQIVRAAEVFQDHIYFAGDFTTAANAPMNGLTYSPFDGPPTSTYEGALTEKNIQVFNYENQLHIQYENLNSNSTLHLFNLQGQMVRTIALPSGTQQVEVNLADWAGGMYVYQVVSKHGKQAGKFHVN